MASIERRIAQIEGRLPDDRWLEWLVELGRKYNLANEQNYREHLDLNDETAAEHGIEKCQPNWISKRHLLDEREKGDVFFFSTEAGRSANGLEQLRGFWPDRLIKAAYGASRPSTASTDADVRKLQFAGVLDEAGNLRPGYRVLEDGHIVEWHIADELRRGWGRGRAGDGDNTSTGTYCRLCRECGVYFWGDDAMDLHFDGLVGERRCVPLSELQEKGLALDANGFWRETAHT